MKDDEKLARTIELLCDWWPNDSDEFLHQAALMIISVESTVDESSEFTMEMLHHAEGVGYRLAQLRKSMQPIK